MKKEISQKETSRIGSKKIIKEMELAGRKLTLEAGSLAPQANKSVLASYGETVVLATAVAQEPTVEVDFFPLRVDYEEKLYAGGFIKTSRFVKREGRPTDEATIAARLIDHAIRPLFPKDYLEDVQVVVTVLSVDEKNDPEVLSLVAASAVLAASDIPWSVDTGPLGTVRVGYRDGQLLLNPSMQEEDELALSLVYSGLKGDRALAIEGRANRVSEKIVWEAIEFGQREVQPIVKLIEDFAAAVGKKKMAYEPRSLSKDLVGDVTKFAGSRMRKIIQTPMDKLAQREASEELLLEIYAEFEGQYTKGEMKRTLDELEKQAVKKLVLEDNQRVDGRRFDEIRPIQIEVGVLPRTHGSALFTRGLTQSLTIATLGSASLEQLIQNMYGEETKCYIHHYNSPPFSFGEVRPLRGPGRRDIGHGMLAEKALLPVIPDETKFPYTIRMVSEILSQNGSSSMAATCASSLALMDAGVPISGAVGGVSIGLVADDQLKKYQILTDIAGPEDFNGQLDFKMTGTAEGVTAVQMDIKLPGLPLKILKEVVDRSREARQEILAAMDKVLAAPREKLSVHAPRVIQLQVKEDQIGTIIGPGGKMIKSIIAESGAKVDVEDRGGFGIINIASTDPEAAEKAKMMIERLVQEAEVGEVYEGTVTSVVDFGAFVEILPGKEGLLHVSELSHDYVADPRRVIKVGDSVKVKVLDVDRGRISLSKKALEKPPDRPLRRPATAGGHHPSSGPARPGSSGESAGYRTPYQPRPGYRPSQSGGRPRRPANPERPRRSRDYRR